MIGYDYIIAGAGSAGCVLANRLSRDPTIEVLLVGGCYTNPLFDIQSGSGKLLDNDPYARRYVTKPFEPGQRFEYWPRGKGFGGSSFVNGMVYTRGHREDYDGLERLGNKGWGWDDMLPIFKAIEDNEFGASLTRGGGGPLHISVPRYSDPLCRELIEPATKVGLREVQDINESDDERIGPVTSMIKNGRRVSAVDVFLAPARHRPNLTVLTDAFVRRVVLEDGRAAGVWVTRRSYARGYTEEIRAGREVIVALGSLGSPKLMQLSGIGPRDVLRAARVPVFIESEHVGRRMREHRCVAVTYRLKDNRAYRRHPVMSRGHAVTGGKGRAACMGLPAAPAYDLVAFVKTDPTLERVDGQLLLGTLRPVTRESGWSAGAEALPGISCLGQVLRPTSEGWVEITSANPEDALMIEPNCFTSAYDRTTGAALLRTIREIFTESAIADRISHETFPGPNAQSDELIDSTLDIGYCGNQAAGTCAMGPSDDDVVDDRLRVRGVSGLRVVDCSIMPTMVAGNLNGPIMAMAWRAADMILQDREG